jgi:23S rRNA G2069 N7-methylase RlmK/C1962 C5-methylase RlmI
MELNGLAGPQHRFICSDAPHYLRQLPQVATYDLAVVDPPTFSNSKRTDEDWEVQRDHAELLNALLRVMKPDAVVFFSTNFRRFKLDEEAIATSRIHEISRQTVPPDFRNRRIHRCWRIVCGAPR